MFHYVILIVAVSAAAVHGYRIVGGQDATIEEFPYQVSVEHLGKHLCGGSILASDKVLTAAHCTIHYQLNDIKVRAGSTLREEGGHLIALSKKTEHPDFNIFMFKNNVGVLTLAIPLNFSDTVQPIEISKDDVPVNTVGYLTGWGMIRSDGSGELPKTLQKLQVARVSEDKCKGSYGNAFIAETMVCFGNKKGESGCGNDSGGPVVVDGKQVGVVASGIMPCDGTNPVLYSKLSYFKDLIESW